MKFWIVTPSYNQLDWLKLCVASVADQATAGVRRSALGVGEEPIEVHHHVQDARSTDGTVDWLRQYDAKVREQRTEDHPNAQNPAPNASLSGYTFSYASEPDNGMYDAINRGWKLAPDDVDVIAHLNCDEQYLPNALKTIVEFMQKHPKADVVFADMIVVDAKGEYICHRRAIKPFSITSRFCCAGFTATTFQRASVTQQKGVFFDTSWRNFGDKVWYNALHEAGCRFSVCNQLVSVFTDTGENLNWTEEGLGEKRRYEIEFLSGKTFGARWVSRINAARRFLKEFCLSSPSCYSIYLDCDKDRVNCSITNPTGRWHKTWST